MNSEVISPPEPLFFANFPSGYEETSFFGTVTYYFTPEFDISLGARFTDFEQDIELDTRNTILVAPLPFNQIDDDVEAVPCLFLDQLIERPLQ